MRKKLDGGVDVEVVAPIEGWRVAADAVGRACRRRRFA
jgi:hypothetical protein